MDNGDWRGIEVGIAYVAEAKFSNTEAGKRMAREFLLMLKLVYPNETTYAYGLK